MSWPAQSGGGWTQNAHYALVRSLADGTPRIDRYHEETGDASYHRGHYYSVKGPGVAFVALPVYSALRAVGLWPDETRSALWLLALITSAIPALVLVWLVARVAEALEPGSGLAVGLTLGTATLILPFATVAFSHVWSALLAFACFAVLLRERRGSMRLGLVATAGGLAGVGVLFEYPTALAGLILGFLAIARQRWFVRGLVYVGGVLVGVAPLFVYNRWAFGSPFTLSYQNAIIVRGDSGHDIVGAHSQGVFGITQPSLRTLAELLLSDRGLLITTPVVAAGVAGLVLLIRSGRNRAAAGAALGISLAFPVYNAGVTTTFGGAFGGWSPGPRYLITALPFALVALGCAYRRAPTVVLALALVSSLVMTAATATVPLVEATDVHRWWDGVRQGNFAHTIPWLLGWQSTGFLAILPMLACILVVVAIAARSFIILRRPVAADVPAAVTALAAWALILIAARPLVNEDPSLQDSIVALTVVGVSILLVVAATVRAPMGHDPDPG